MTHFPMTPEAIELRKKIFDLMPNPKTDMGYHYTDGLMDAIITDLSILCDKDAGEVRRGLQALMESAEEKIQGLIKSGLLKEKDSVH